MEVMSQHIHRSGEYAGFVHQGGGKMRWSLEFCQSRYFLALCIWPKGLFSFQWLCSLQHLYKWGGVGWGDQPTSKDYCEFQTRERLSIL